MDPQPYTKIPGLTLLPDFITKEQQKILIDAIKTKPWNTSLKRRTQHYGYQYGYDRKSVATKTVQIPQQFLFVKQKLQKQLLNTGIQKTQYIFDQLIVNQYQPGQGISPHIDNTTLFDDIVVSVSLGSECTMQFSQGKQKDKLIEMVLQRKSALVLSGEARYEWKHCIPARKKDFGKERQMRYSLTFRKMIL